MKIVKIDEARQHLGTAARWLYDEWGRHMPDGSVVRAEKAIGTMPDGRGLPASFLAFIDHDEPVGIARLIEDDLETRLNFSPWLASVFVPPPFRGQGIGSQLCEHVVHEAQRLGFSTLYLFTRDRENFYSRQGWIVVERTAYQGQGIVIMKKIPGE
jgi:GNAT superfamily N-acetyltransferase